MQQQSEQKKVIIAIPQQVKLVANIAFLIECISSSWTAGINN